MEWVGERDGGLRAATAHELFSRGTPYQGPRGYPMCHYGRDELAHHEYATEDERDDEADAAEATDDEERRPVAPSADD